MENTKIHKTDIPCRQCCNIAATEKTGRYTPHSCNEAQIRECVAWQVLDIPETKLINPSGDRRVRSGK